jgi:DNA-binding GntR family transcriptional regulator
MQQAYDEIKRRIVTLELLPGQRLDDVALSNELALSRTPIREAIFLLGSEGLIDVKSDAGIIVRPLDLLDTAQLIEMQFIIVKAVSRLAAERIDPKQLRQLRGAADEVEAAIKSRDALAITSRNADFHRIEATAAGNSRLLEVARSIEDERQRLAYVCFGGTRPWGHLDEHFRKVVRDHQWLIEAYDAHDPDRAEKTAVSHVLLFRDRILQYLSVEEPRYTITAGELRAVSLTQELVSGDT